MKHLRYLKYVLRHKWFVALACAEYGLWRAAIFHDWHKFLPREWIPYVNHFFGPQAREWRDKTGYYKPTDTGDPAFDRAWFWHQKLGRHHWQWWTQPDGDKTLAVEMPTRYAIEMVCDWRGAGRAQGRPDVQAWYRKHRDDLILHPTTRTLVEFILALEVDDADQARP